MVTFRYLLFDFDFDSLLRTDSCFAALPAKPDFCCSPSKHLVSCLHIAVKDNSSEWVRLIILAAGSCLLTLANTAPSLHYACASILFSCAHLTRRRNLYHYFSKKWIYWSRIPDLHHLIVFRFLFF